MYLSPLCGRTILGMYLLIVCTPTWAASYSENMAIQEYIVGIAALLLIGLDVGQRAIKRPEAEKDDSSELEEDAKRKVSTCPVMSVSSGAMTCLIQCIGPQFHRVKEVVLNQPVEGSLLITAFTLLTLTRIPFSFSAVLVGVLTYTSMVLGARLAALSSHSKTDSCKKASSCSSSH